MADKTHIDITSEEAKAVPTVDNAVDMDKIKKMKRTTVARIGVGRAGPRLKTKTLLTLRADHAAAKDSVLCDVDEKYISDMGLFVYV